MSTFELINKHDKRHIECKCGSKLILDKPYVNCSKCGLLHEGDQYKVHITPKCVNCDDIGFQYIPVIASQRYETYKVIACSCETGRTFGQDLQGSTADSKQDIFSFRKYYSENLQGK